MLTLYCLFTDDPLTLFPSFFFLQRRLLFFLQRSNNKYKKKQSLTVISRFVYWKKKKKRQHFLEPLKVISLQISGKFESFFNTALGKEFPTCQTIETNFHRICYTRFYWFRIRFFFSFLTFRLWNYYSSWRLWLLIEES